MSITIERRRHAYARLTRSVGIRWVLTGAVFLTVVIGAALRVGGIDRPLDHRTLSLWHEADYAQIARNFFREDMNPLYPRIDWRGTTPGYVEMELPAIPWLAALTYPAIGIEPRVMRVLSAIAALGSLLVFSVMARRVLSNRGALVAISAFALSPLPIYLATTMQPESMVVLLVLLAIELAWRWSEAADPPAGLLIAASGLLGLAILIKQPAAAIGLVFAWIVINRLSWQVLTRGEVAIAAALALAPAILWYAWAHQFWLEYGNSLGLSNEDHFAGFDVLWSRVILGNLHTELLFVVGPFGGFLIAACGLIDWRRSVVLVSWYLAVIILYLVAGRTTGAHWAFYYHVLSAAPACLLMGLGFEALLRRRFMRVALVLGAGSIAGLVAATMGLLAARDGIGWLDRDHMVSFQGRAAACAEAFRPLIPPDAKLLARGLESLDALGYRVAGNDPSFFVWLDRRGFHYRPSDLRLDRLEYLAAQGASLWIVPVADLDLISPAIERRFPEIARCPEGFSLRQLNLGRSGAFATQ